MPLEDEINSLETPGETADAEEDLSSSVFFESGDLSLKPDDSLPGVDEVNMDAPIEDRPDSLKTSSDSADAAVDFFDFWGLFVFFESGDLSLKPDDSLSGVDEVDMDALEIRLWGVGSSRALSVEAFPICLVVDEKSSRHREGLLTSGLRPARLMNLEEALYILVE